MIAVRVVGDSGAGKTTLVERLVPALDGRVATIKSIHHDVEFDEPGKDTYRHRAAGAERVIGITPARTVSFETRGKDDFPSEAAALADLLVDLHDRGYEYVVVEGFASVSASALLPAIVVGDRDVADGERLTRVTDAASVDVERLAARIEGLDTWTRTEPP